MALRSVEVLARALATALLLASTRVIAQDITPPKVYTTTPGGVSLADGSFTYSDEDFSIGDLTLSRFSLGGKRDPNVPFFGPGMSHNFDIYVTPTHRTVCTGQGNSFCTNYKMPIVHLGTSASGKFYETYPPNSVLLHSDQDSYAGELTHPGGVGAYTYVDAQGSVYSFSDSIPATGAPYSQRVTSILNPDGRLQEFLYDGAYRLKAVRSSSGYGIVFDYNVAGTIATACGYSLSAAQISSSSTCASALVATTYGYSASGNLLTSATNPLEQTTTLGRSGRFITCVQPPGYTACKINNEYGNGTYPWQVTRQVMIDGAIWQYQYSGDYNKPRDPEKYVDVEPSTRATVTDPNGRVSTYDFVETSPYTMIDADNRSTSYRYSGGWDFNSDPDFAQHYGSQLEEVTLPEGNKYRAEYYANRNAVSKQTLIAKPNSGVADQVVTYGYPTGCDAPATPQNCAKPIYKIDAKNNRADFAYAGWGGVISEMGPPPSAGAARPLKLYSYAQKYAYISNGAGGLVPAASAIWKLTSMTECETSPGSNSPVCNASGFQRTTTYQYGADGTADNLLLRGQAVTADGQTLRSCYAYDARGNKISETSPRAGLGVCP